MKSLVLLLLVVVALLGDIALARRRKDERDSVTTWLENMEKAFEEANHELAKQDRDTESLEKDEKDEVETLFSGAFPSTGFFNHLFRNGIPPPWWKGSNVCTTKSEELSPFPGGSAFWTTSLQTQSCYDDADVYVCISKTTTDDGTQILTTNVTRQCCHGYRRGRKGCYAVDLKTVMETLEQMGASEYVALAKGLGLEDKFQKKNVTVFAFLNSQEVMTTTPSQEETSPPPADEDEDEEEEEVEDFQETTESEIENELTVPAYRRRRSIDLKVQYMNKAPPRHRRELPRVYRDPVLPMRASYVDGYRRLDANVDEKVLRTKDDSVIRLNLFRGPNGSRRYTANCAVVARPNIEASNGFIHQVETPVVKANRPLSQILEQEPRYSKFVHLLKNTEWWDQLEDPKSKMTVIAPNNDAFMKLPEKVLDAWRRGESCLRDVMGNHLLSFTLCSGAVWSSCTVRTLSDHVLPLRPEPDHPGVLLSGEARMDDLDVVGTNGVLHETDTVLIPESARSLRDALEDSNKEWTNLLTEAGFDFSMTNVTVMALTDSALENPDVVKMLKEARQKPEGLHELVMTYMAPGTTLFDTCDVFEGMVSPSWLSPLVPNSRPKLFVSSAPPPFRSARPPTIQCNPIGNVVNLCNGNRIIQMNSPLVVTNKTLLDYVTEDPQLSMFAQLIKKSEKWSKELRSADKDAFTLLAPYDKAWKAIGETDAAEFNDKPKLVDSIIGAHILKDPVCCEGAPSWPFTGKVETIDGDSFGFRREMNNQVFIEKAGVLYCNRHAKNGVMHLIDTVLIPRLHQRLGGWLFDGERPGGHGNVDTMLFGI